MRLACNTHGFQRSPHFTHGAAQIVAAVTFVAGRLRRFRTVFVLVAIAEPRR